MKKMKLDFESDLEKLFLGIIIMGGSFLLIALYCLLEDEGRAVMKFSLVAGPILIAVGIILRKMTDNYYYLDFDRQLLIYHFEFQSYVKEVTVAHKNEIAAIGIEASKYHSEEEEENTWSYSMFFLLNDLNKIPLSDPKQDCLNKLNGKIEKIADALQIEAYPSPGFCFPVITWNAEEKPILTYGEVQPPESKKRKKTMLVAIGAVLLVIFLIFLAMR